MLEINMLVLQKNFQSKINLLNVTDKHWAGTKNMSKKILKITSMA